MQQRILVHDYSGHAFQPQLSRRLAARGHEVLHVYSQSVQIPQGALKKTDRDPLTLQFDGIRLSAVINKQAYLKRYFQERAYGRLLEDKIRRFRPDVVISSSTPLDAQASAVKASKAMDARFVFWLQDIQGIAIDRLLGARFNGMGSIIGRYYTAIEKRLLRQSDAVVAITDDFRSILTRWGVEQSAINVIPNWAPIEDLPPRPKDNPWARAHGLADKTCFLYSGTLGLKHNADLLLKLGIAYRDQPGVAIVVVSEGRKAEWLKSEQARLGLSGLHVLPFQPYEQLPDVMGSADVLVAILDSDAGLYSVPSKVLAYHCAARPVLLSVPGDNLAASIVRDCKSGAVVDPADVTGFLKAAEELLSSATRREELGKNALRYAQTNFDLDRITDRFEALFASLASGEVSGEFEHEVAHERT